MAPIQSFARLFWSGDSAPQVQFADSSRGAFQVSSQRSNSGWLREQGEHMRIFRLSAVGQGLEIDVCQLGELILCAIYFTLLR